MASGYYRYPTLFKDKVVFTCEDDLWECPVGGGVARRLTAGVGSCSRPQYSPDGKWLAFSSAEEGHVEIYVMPSEGGETTRLTYLASASSVCGWRDNDTVLFASTAFAAHRAPAVCRINKNGGLPESLRFGPAVNVNFGAAGEVLLERNAYRADPAYWKRYRGGTAGKILYAESAESPFKYLLDLNGNLSRPFFFGERVYFLSDHEGVGNLYSCARDGGKIERVTHHKDFYVRSPSTDGKGIVYHAGADLFYIRAVGEKSEKIAVEYRSQRPQRQRKFVATHEFMEEARLGAKGDRVLLTARGQVHEMGTWDGPVATLKAPAVRHRMARYMGGGDDRKVVYVSDQNGEERLHLQDLDSGHQETFDHVEWGRFTQLLPAPKGDLVAFANHRNELWVADLAARTSRRVARNLHSPMDDFSWSADGKWLAFSLSQSWNRKGICIADARTGEYKPVSEPLFDEHSPVFDPSGRYLYFLSIRELNPVYDGVQFELSFPKGVLPCLVTLQNETPSPFLTPVKLDKGGKGEEVEKAENTAERGNPTGDAAETRAKSAKAVEIDFEGISRRILAFPVAEAKYTKISATENKVFLMSVSPEGALNDDWLPKDPPAKGHLEVYDFTKLKLDSFYHGVSDFSLSPDLTQLLLRIGNRLRSTSVGEKPKERAPQGSGGEKTGRESGWLEVGRAKTLIEPGPEWRQMLHEVWRLQRDHFWREDMSKIEWSEVLNRYLPLLERVSCRSEFGDLVWEVQGELGTSHAYDIGGDYRREPYYPVGLLGADFSFDEAGGGYRIEKILRGDPWKLSEASPLAAPGIGLEKGDVITAINGQKLSAQTTPHQLLLHQAGAEVRISVRKKGDTAAGAEISLRVRTLHQETGARYREWVETNRDHVRAATGGRIGYIHIPDMGARGFAEFHRHFLRDYDCDGLIVDLRYNGGGHVSQLLLEKLCRRRMGSDHTRWFGTMPFPSESPAGPMVALTNEFAGSDGDIFSHSFKLRKAGPLIGRRTWGGVIGIWPRHRLVDGGVTTQPEFSHWFEDTGWQIENFGATPDIDVDILPHEYRAGHDPQLERGVREVLRLVESNPPFRPKVIEFPDLRPRIEI